MKLRRILVTGAAGFIGGRVAAALARDGLAVRAGTRRPAHDHIQGVDWVACDLDRPVEVEAALEGVDLVIHAAYGDETAMVGQAETLLQAMTARGIVNLAAFSSIAVYGRRAGVIREDDEPLRLSGAYARSKRACEALYESWACNNSARRAIVLRPGIVYGAGSKFWIDKLARRILCGGWGVFGDQGDGRAALIHVDDLTRQCAAASALLLSDARLALAAVEAVNCVGPDCPRWNDYFQVLARALGEKPLRRWSRAEILARQILAAPAKIANRLGFPVARRLALAPTPGELALFSLDVEICGEKARRLLGCAPDVRLADGLARCDLPRRKNGQDTRPRP